MRDREMQMTQPQAFKCSAGPILPQLHSSKHQIAILTFRKANVSKCKCPISPCFWNDEPTVTEENKTNDKVICEFRVIKHISIARYEPTHC